MLGRDALLARPGRGRLPHRRGRLHHERPRPARRPAPGSRPPPVARPPRRPRGRSGRCGPCSTGTTRPGWRSGRSTRTTSPSGPPTTGTATNCTSPSTSRCCRRRGRRKRCAAAWRRWRLLCLPGPGPTGSSAITTSLAWLPVSGRAAARVAAMLLLTLRGAPTLYYGDELGLPQLEVPPERQQDPFGRRVPGRGRDGCRTPMPWDGGPHAGFCPPGVEPWLPLGPEAPGAQRGGATRGSPVPPQPVPGAARRPPGVACPAPGGLPDDRRGSRRVLRLPAPPSGGGADGGGAELHRGSPGGPGIGAGPHRGLDRHGPGRGGREPASCPSVPTRGCWSRRAPV